MTLSDFERRDAKGQFSGSPYTCSYPVTNNGRNFRHANSWGRVGALWMGSSTTEGAANRRIRTCESTKYFHVNVLIYMFIIWRA